jgi:transposase-like protein
MAYASGFRERMVQRMTGPAAASATVLARETGVSQPTLSRWRAAAPTVPRMNTQQPDDAKGAKSPQQWTAEEKLAAVQATAGLREQELGAFLRERGLHAAQLESWRAAVKAALTTHGPRRAGASKETQRIRALEKELLRKDRALAEVTALLALRKKLEALWGDEADGTSKRSDP